MGGDVIRQLVVIYVRGYVVCMTSLYRLILQPLFDLNSFTVIFAMFMRFCDTDYLVICWSETGHTHTSLSI